MEALEIQEGKLVNNVRLGLEKIETPAANRAVMEQYHYIWVFKALFILAGMVTQHIVYVYIKKSLRKGMNSKARSPGGAKNEIRYLHRY